MLLLLLKGYWLDIVRFEGAEGFALKDSTCLTDSYFDEQLIPAARELNGLDDNIYVGPSHLSVDPSGYQYFYFVNVVLKVEDSSKWFSFKICYKLIL